MEEQADGNGGQGCCGTAVGAAWPRLLFALALAAVGAGAAAAGSRIELSGFTDPNDPGPRMVPTAAGLVLLAGGITEFFRWWFSREGGGLGDGGAGGAGAPVVAMGAGIVVYVAALPYLGFVLSTFVFTFSMVCLLGGRWWAGLTTAVVTVGSAGLIFVGLFKVQLPAGVLGLPF